MKLLHHLIKRSTYTILQCHFRTHDPAYIIVISLQNTWFGIHYCNITSEHRIRHTLL